MVRLAKFKKGKTTKANPSPISVSDALDETVRLYGGVISRIPERVFERANAVREKALNNELKDLIIKGDNSKDYAVSGKTRGERIASLKLLIKQQKETNVNSS